MVRRSFALCSALSDLRFPTRRDDVRAGVLVDDVVVDSLLEDVLEQGVDLVHARPGKAALLAHGGVGRLDHLGVDVLDGEVAQVALDVLEASAVLGECAL